MRPTNVFETKAIQDYFQSSHLAKIRYACVRAKELDDDLGGSQNTDYFNACIELSNAIRESIGLAPATMNVAMSVDAPEGVNAVYDEDKESITYTDKEPVGNMALGLNSEAPPLDAFLSERAELLEEFGFPATKDELNDDLSKKKIVAILQHPDNADLAEDLGITLEVCSFKKAALLTFIYEGGK